jgi:hypothetical protein
MHASGVADGTRTHDNRNHNPGLYQLSYSHRWKWHAQSRAARSIIRGYALTAVGTGNLVFQRCSGATLNFNFSGGSSSGASGSIALRRIGPAPLGCIQ